MLSDSWAWLRTTFSSFGADHEAEPILLLANRAIIPRASPSTSQAQCVHRLLSSKASSSLWSRQRLLTHPLLKVQTRPCLAGSRLWWVRTGLGVLAHVSSSLGYRLSPAYSLCNVLCGPQEQGQARLCYPVTWTCSCAFKAIDGQGPGRRDPTGCEGPQDLSLDFSWRCAPCLLSRRLEAARLSSMNSVKT